MRILVSGNTRTVRELALVFPNHLGHLLTPDNGNNASVIDSGLLFAADNAAFSGLNLKRFRKMLNVLQRRVANCLFVVCPDVVANATATLEFFKRWHDEVAEIGAPLAFVGQDGAENLTIPWDEFDAWFIGGSDRWKMSQSSVDLALEAKKLGKYLHCGRVNSQCRLRWAQGIGCDSVDGQSYSRWRQWLERDLKFLVSLDRNVREQRLFSWQSKKEMS